MRYTDEALLQRAKFWNNVVYYRINNLAMVCVLTRSESERCKKVYRIQNLVALRANAWLRKLLEGRL